MDDEYQYREKGELLVHLKIPLLSDATVAAVRDLEEQWRRIDVRASWYLPSRIETDRALAYREFVENPTDKNGQRLMAMADPMLCLTRYAFMHKGWEDVCKRLSRSAAERMIPEAEAMLAALSEEHERRLAVAEPVMSNKHRNPIMKEARWAMEALHKLVSGLYGALRGEGGNSPLTLAGWMVPGVKG